jgi:hypothetical protein
VRFLRDDDVTEISPLERLEAALSDTSNVYVGAEVDEASYFSGLAEDIRRHMCEPFQASAEVMPPGFPGIPLGSTITGLCVARRDGYWLVYQPESDCFYCFWGTDLGALGAHGVFGSPLYCWSA